GGRSPAFVPVRFVSVAAPAQGFFLAPRRSRTASRGAPTGKAAAPNPRETHDAARPDRVDRIRYDLSDAGAFNEDVRFEADATDGAGVVGRAEGAHKLRLSGLTRSGQEREHPGRAARQVAQQEDQWGQRRSQAPSAVPKTNAGRPQRPAPTLW